MTTAEHSDHSTTMSSAEATLCAQLPREAQKTLYSVLSRVALPSEADEKCIARSSSTTPRSSSAS